MKQNYRLKSDLTRWNTQRNCIRWWGWMQLQLQNRKSVRLQSIMMCDSMQTCSDRMMMIERTICRVFCSMLCVCVTYSPMCQCQSHKLATKQENNRKIPNICIPFRLVFLVVRSTMRNITELLCNNQRKTKGYGFENDGKDSIECDNLSKDLPSNNNNILNFGRCSFFFDGRRLLSLRTVAIANGIRSRSGRSMHSNK